jgi:hypothetical protein
MLELLSLNKEKKKWIMVLVGLLLEIFRIMLVIKILKELNCIVKLNYLVNQFLLLVKN